MRTYIALLPGIISILMLRYQSAAKVFINFYIPVLLMLPQFFVAEIPALPNLSFAQSALIPIFFSAFFFGLFSSKRMSLGVTFTDLLVLTYLFLTVMSEYKNTGFEESAVGGILWVSLLSHLVLTAIMPYFAVRSLITSNELSVAMAKKIVICVLITIFLCLYEWRFVLNLHVDLLQPFFRDQGLWVGTFRYGFARISGPFIHPILFGVMITITLSLNYWLSKEKYWKRNFSALIPLPLSKGTILGILLFIGLLLTSSRGPLLGFLFGALFLGIAHSRYKYLNLTIKFFAIFVLTIFVWNVAAYYSTIDKSMGSANWGRNISYRLELIGEYYKYIQQKPFWGWGYTTWPTAEGLKSIDNHYLWKTMQHGFLSTGVQFLLFVIPSIRLFFLGLSRKIKDKKIKSFAFALLSIYIMMAISFVTVFMGYQLETVFFMIVAWSESFIQNVKRKWIYAEELPVEALA